MKLNFLILQRDPYVIGSAIGAGTSLLGDIFNLFGSSKANREQRDYNTSIINQQRQWALEDIKNQNQYNSPVEQMNRLKQAGLNPNMVYGTGVTGSTGQQTSQPRPTSAPGYAPMNIFASFANLGTQLAGAINTMAAAVATSQKTPQDIAASKTGQLGTLQGIEESKQNVKESQSRQGKIAQDIAESQSRVNLQSLQAAHQEIENTILGSNGRADPANRSYFRELDAFNASAESDILENERRASKNLPLKANQELTNLRDENTRAWALNTRQTVLQNQTIQGMKQDLSNAIKQNTNLDQEGKLKAAQTLSVLDNLPQGKLDASGMAMASDMVDYLILALQLSQKKGGIQQKTPTGPFMPGMQNFKY